MKFNLRIPLFMTLIVVSAGIGSVGVYASTDCQHLFRAYKEQLAKHLHHKVSAETLARWAAWNKAHPHYRPSRKESMAKIDFVCQVPMDQSAMSQDLPAVQLPPLLDSMTEAFTEPSQPNITVSNVIPPDNPLQPPTGDPEYPPVYYPGPPVIIGGGGFAPPPISDTPEPGSLILMTTALGLLSGLVFWKRHLPTNLRRTVTLS